MTGKQGQFADRLEADGWVILNKDEAEAARKALDFAQHAPTCMIVLSHGNQGVRCTCGFDKAMKAVARWRPR